jgi:uncharacterized protein involved in propanediol utilization
MVSQAPAFERETAKKSVHPKLGHGKAESHHGEIFQGVVAESCGRLHRGLVSLPCALKRSLATFYPTKYDTVTVTPGWRVKARRAAELTLQYVKSVNSEVPGGLEVRGGHLQVQSNIPLKWGLGSSTSDVTATINATADAFGVAIRPDVIARIAVRAEIASDSLMFGERAILFAHREGIILEDFGGYIPRLVVLGFNTDPTGAGVDTLASPPARYEWWEIEAFRPLIGLLRKAIKQQSLRLVGKIASASARMHQRHLPKPYFDKIERLCDDIGALGLQVAHSGTIVGILFDGDDSDLENRIVYGRVKLAEIGFDAIWQFNTGDSGWVGDQEYFTK